MSRRIDLRSRYGPWAIVAGASEGLGAAFARALAGRGLDVVLIARREERLGAFADALSAASEVEVRTMAADLGSPGLGERLRRETADLEVGVAVYNAAFAPLGAFVERSLAELAEVVDVNVRGPLTFARVLAEPMAARGRGALVLVSSLAGGQGTPRLAAYAASKAFNTVLAESLWAELRPRGVDVLACCAGAIRTPGYAGAARRDAPGTLDPEAVAERTLAALGRGPRVVPGGVNRLASWLVGRLLPRRLAIRIMAANTRDLT